MTPGRPHRRAFSLAVIAAGLLAWAAAGLLGAPSSGTAAATAAPTAHRAAACDAKCQAANDRHRDKRAALRRKNARQKRPNVVLINTDDMNVTDMFVMRNTLSLLGAHGTTFRNGYVTYPLCCPSRATQLTGQYAHNHGVLTDQRFTDLDSSNTLAVWLKRAKYRTAMVGKYLNGYGVVDPRQVPPGWKQWFGAHRRNRAEALRLQAQRKRKGPELPAQARQLHRLRARLQGQRAAQGVGAQPEAVLPLLQPEQPARGEGDTGLVHARSRARTSIPGSIRRHPGTTPPRTSMSPTSRTSRSRSAKYPVSTTSSSPTSTAATAAGSRACSPSTTRSRRSSRWSASTGTSARPSSSSPRTTASSSARTGSSSRTTSTRRASGSR